MNFKRMTFWLLLLLSLSTPAFAQQATKADIQALDAKITNLQITVTEMDKRITNQIVELDKRLTIQITELDNRLTSQINVLFWAIGTLILVVLAVIALPQLLGYFQDKRERAGFQKRLDALEQKVEQQRQEIETLKSRRMLTPS